MIDLHYRLPLCWVAVISLVFVSANSLAQDAAKLKYDWNPGQKYGYEFDVNYEIDGDSRKLNGYVTYHLQKKDVSKNLANEDLEIVEEGEATSTAFAVTSDGYLLTCAHCVRGAKTVEVVVDEKKVRAKVVEADYDRDLALIKIEAKDLPIVSLGKEKKVELAQDVRAIGFPLSDVLGSSVKVTRGSIAGFVDEGDEEKAIQIDAAVNHGNSGGPLVDESGAVVGVVNAKLSGAEIAKVGFAIPIKLACQMLDRHNVEYESAANSEKLSGPDLARKISPAVFFVNAEIGPGGANHFSNFRFSTKGSMTKPVGNRRTEEEVIQSDAIIDSDGTLLDSANETRLPLMLGTVCQMPFEMLPQHSRKSWSTTDLLVIPLPKSAPRLTVDPFDPFGGFHAPRLSPRFRGFFRGLEPAQPEAKTEMRMAFGRSTTTYKVVDQKDNLVTISKKFELKTVGDEDEFSNLRMNRESTLTFDTGLGIFVGQKMKGKVKIKLGEKSFTFPITMSYRQIDLDAYLKSSKSDRKGELAADKTKPGNVATADDKPEPSKPRVMPPIGLSIEQVDQFLAHETEQVDSRELLAYLNRLSNWNDLPNRKPEIVKALKQVIASETSNTKKLAIEALLNWDRAEATPFVLEGFHDASAFSKRSWIVKLGRTQHADAALVLCEQLKLARFRAHAKLALMELGASGETAVAALLSKTTSEGSEDEAVAGSCLEVLGKIGTDSSLGVLQKLIDAGPLKSDAENALKMISGRKK